MRLFREIQFAVLEGGKLVVFKGATSIELTAKGYLIRKMREEFAEIKNFKERVKAYVADWLDYYNDMNEDFEFNTDLVIDEISEHLTHSDGMLIDRIKRRTASHEEQLQFCNALKSIMIEAHK